MTKFTKKFIEYMSNPVFGFTESEHKMPMITSFITPEEAEFLTGFPMSEASLDEIADLKRYGSYRTCCENKGALQERLDLRGYKGRFSSFTNCGLPVKCFLRVPYWSGRGEETC